MKNLVILVPESAVLQTISGPQYCFGAVNRFLVASGGTPAFNIRLAGARKEVRLDNEQFSVYPDLLLDEVKDCDLLLIPAVLGHMQEVIRANEGIVDFIKDQYIAGSEVASFCVGAFILGATGLLNGSKCSTHWNYIDEFRCMFPEVEVLDGSIITEENGIYTSGGANSYWNLMLHIVEKYVGREMAVMAAKYFAIDIDRNSQAAYSVFRGQKEHRDDAVKKAQEFIELNVEGKYTVDDLADMVAVGRRSFERRFRQATRNSVLEYIQRVKIEAAKRSFETSRRNISEVMYDVGYNDIKAFRNVFKKITGLTPAEYRDKYNKILQN